MVSRKKFYKFICDYIPLNYYEEVDRKDPRFDFNKKPVNYCLINRERFYITLKYALKHFSQAVDLTILDLGAYPGTFLRLLREFSPQNKLYGAGLNFQEDFIRAIKEKSGADMLLVNLDPQNEQLKSKNYPNLIPLADETMDFVFALEIIEHLTSPVHMLSEVRRVLKKGGRILITTPNITRIGSLFKLSIGRSNLDYLMSRDYYDENDEWRPHFREYSMEELANLLIKLRFKVADKIFFNSGRTYFNVKGLKQKLVDLAKAPFCWAVPYFKENILVVAEKTD